MTVFTPGHCPICALKRYWQESRVAIRPGISNAALAEHERRLGIALPPEVARYFRDVDGMDPHSYGLNEIRLWPLEECHLLSDGRHDDVSYLVFADFLIASHEYAIEISRAPYPVVIVAEHMPADLVADSFETFIRCYVNDSGQLLIKRAPSRLRRWWQRTLGAFGR